MRRNFCTPRDNWQETVESQGFHYHTVDDQPYWDESAYYEFTAAEVDTLEAATYALDEMCLQAVDSVIQEGRFEPFQIPPEVIPYIRQSWDRDEITIYGRFDLAFDGRQPPKLLEYNADTPTSLLEAAVVQWYWFKDTHEGLDQFNSIHERLIEAWNDAKGFLQGVMYFTSLREHMEDFVTVNYLRDTAIQAGWQTDYIAMEDIGWDSARQRFVDRSETPIQSLFKLYPWEWMVREQFGPHILNDTVSWLEPPWKMLLSNKAILPILYELFPDSPYLLPAAFEPIGDSYVRKPILAREGANVAIVRNNQIVYETEGDYGEPYVYQRLFPLVDFGGNFPILGSWMVNGYACGMGIREDVSPVTGNTSRFVPHVFRK